jgi:hypothetical protein
MERKFMAWMNSAGVGTRMQRGVRRESEKKDGHGSGERPEAGGYAAMRRGFHSRDVEEEETVLSIDAIGAGV